MNTSDYTLNLLLEDNGIQDKLKTFQDSFDTLGGSIGVLGQTMSLVSSNMVLQLDAVNASMNRFSEALSLSAAAQLEATAAGGTSSEKMKEMQEATDNLNLAIYNVSGGWSVYAGAALNCLTTIADLLPLYGAMNTVIEATSAIDARALIASKAKTAYYAIAGAAARAYTGIQSALNMVMSNNPIGMVSKAIMVLVTSFTVVYNNCSGFRDMIDSAWESISNLASIIWDVVVEAFKSFLSVLEPVWDSLKKILGIQEDTAKATGNYSEASGKASKATTQLAAANEKAAASSGLFSGALDNQNRKLKLNLDTVGGIESRISELSTLQKNASEENAIKIGKEIKLLEQKRDLLERNILAGMEGNRDMKYTSLLEAPGAADMDMLKNVKNPKQGADGLLIPVSVSGKEIETATRETASKMAKAFPRMNPFEMVQFGLEGTAKLLKKVGGTVKGSAKEWTDWGSTLSDSIAKTFPKIQEAAGKKDGFAVLQQGLETCGVVLKSLGTMVGSSTKAWVEWGDSLRTTLADVMPKMKESFNNKDTFGAIQQGLVGTATVMQGLKGVVGDTAGAWLTWGASVLQSVAQAIPQIIALTNTQIASATAQVTANTAAAGTGAASSVASIPIVGWIMAGIAVASVIATLATLPKPKPMATGGIVYGNLLAHVGEYPGAANNPEVVAPLNKLRQLIQPAGGFGGGTVEFVIKGNRLVGVLNKEGNKNRYF